MFAVVQLAHLAWIDGEGLHRRFVLDGVRRPVTIGRRAEADVALAHDREVSRVHAELEYRTGEWTITDDGLSQNGTYVNEVRLDGRRRLADGDLIRIGRTRITYSVPDGDGEEVTLLPGDLAAAPAFSDQQQDVLRALCRPLFGDGEGVGAVEEIVVGVGVRVDEARGEDEAACVDGALASARSHVTDGRDAIALDANSAPSPG
jgi:hypothetical protein